MQDKTLRAVRMFEFYVKFIWPIHRQWVRGKYHRRCLHCAASEKMVRLDSAGVCQLCLDSSKDSMPYKRSSELSTQQLAEILASHQAGIDRAHDALVLYSGGKDSTYLIHRIRTEFPRLRLLAYTIDNGFMSPIAKENVSDLIGRLNVDHIFVRPQISFYKKLFRFCVTHLNEEGGYGTLDFSDGEFMLDTARRIAAEKGIPLILCGYSRYQVQNGLKLNHFESPHSRELSDRTETAGLSLKDIFLPEEIERWWQGSKWPPARVARLLFPLYAWDLEEFEIKKKVVEWGLLTKKEYSPAATNHQLIPLLGVIDIHQRGYSSFESEICRMIREGKAEKKEWQYTFEFLEYTAKTGLFLRPTVLESLKKLDLTLADVGIQFKRGN